MKRTLQLRREVLTELGPEELAGVVGAAPTQPILGCVTAAIAVASFVSACFTCLWCTIEVDQ